MKLQPSKSQRSRLWIALALTLSLLIALTWWLPRQTVRAAGSSARATRIAATPAQAPINLTVLNAAALINAINQANSDRANAYVITLNCTGDYTFTTTNNFWYGPNALPPIASNVTIEGAGATLRIVTLVRLRFFYVGADESRAATANYFTPGAGQLTLRNLTLVGGRQQGGDGSAGGAGMGGAIFNQGVLTLDRVTLTDNKATGGKGTGDLNGGGMGAEGTEDNGGGFGGSVGNRAVDNGVAGTNQGAGGGVADGMGGHGGNNGGRAGNGSGGGAERLGGGGGGFGGGFGGTGALVSSAGGNFGSGGQGFLLGDYGGGGGVGGGGGGSSISGGGGGFGGGGGTGTDGGMGGFGGFGGGAGGGINLSGNNASGGFGGGSGGSSFNPNGTGGGGSGGGFGGAIFNHGGVLTVVNSTFTANEARGGSNLASNGGGGSGFGGAIFNLNGSVTLQFATLARNTVVAGPGTLGNGTAAGGAVYQLAYHRAAALAATLTINNSILSDTTGGNDLANHRPATVADGAANLATATLTFTGANLVLTRGNEGGATSSGPAPLTANPLLGTLTVIRDCAAATCAPAVLPIDAGSPAFNAAVADGSVLTDETGGPRVALGGADLGAYEVCCALTKSNWPSNPLAAAAGTPFAQSLAVSGTADTVNWTVTGTLPPGLALSAATGASVELRGTPSKIGTFSFTLRASTDAGCATAQDYTLTVNCPVVPVPPTLSYGPRQVATGGGLIINPTTATTVGTFVNFSGSITPGFGAPGGYTGGLNIDNAGVITVSNAGPAGAFTLTVTGTDSCGGSTTTNFPLLVTGTSSTRANAAPLTINPNVVATPYPAVITMAGLLGTVSKVTTSFTFQNGATPLNPARLRVLLVSPDNRALVLMANAGNSSSLSNTISATFTFDDAAATGMGLFSPLPSATYRPTRFGSGAITFPAPAPTSYNSPAPFGTTTLASTFNGGQANGDWKLFVVNAGSGQATLQNWSLTLTTTPSPCAADLKLSTTDVLLDWAGGSFAIDVRLLKGSSCPWYASTPDSFITITSGTTGTSNGTVTFAVGPVTAARFGTLMIGDHVVRVTQKNLQPGCTGTITVTPPTLTSAWVGLPVSTNVTASGGLAPYNFSTTDPLPAGLTLSSDGTLSGTPTQTGSFPLVLRAVDAKGCQNTVHYTLTVSCPPLTLRPDDLPDGTLGSAYSQALVTVPQGGYQYTVIAGTVPAGLTLNATTGLLSGTPTDKLSTKFTVQVTGAGGCGGQTREYKIKVK